jgi:hypothetical protein
VPVADVLRATVMDGGQVDGLAAGAAADLHGLRGAGLVTAVPLLSRCAADRYEG